MDDVVYLNDLFDIYGDLLTDKQKSYFKDYYFDNLSYGEIAEKYSVSRNASFKKYPKINFEFFYTGIFENPKSFKQLKNVIDKLNELENNLGIYKKNKAIREIINIEKDNNIIQEKESVVFLESEEEQYEEETL